MVAVNPSATERGRLWLTNFHQDDVKAARLLLDGLRFVSGDEFRSGLVRLVSSVVSDRLVDGPVALFPVRPVPKSPKGSVLKGTAGATPPPPSMPLPWAPIEANAGSELITANIITEVAKTLKEGVLPSPGREAMRDVHVRNIVFVDDYAGTGGTVLEYLQWWQGHPTIRSWRSYGLIRFSLVAYAWSSRADRAIRGNRLLDSRPYAIEFDVDFDSAPWTDIERANIRDLCARYATKYARKKDLVLGYKGSEGTFVMAHTTPNNLPNILFNGQRPDGQPWNGFFPPGHRRLGPQQRVELAGYRPSGPSFGELAANVGHPQLSIGKAAGLPRVQPLMAVLAALRRGLRSPDRLARELSLQSFDVDECLATASTLELIDTRLHLTDRGHDELRHAKVRPRRVASRFEGSDEPYYPHSLRRVIDI